MVRDGSLVIHSVQEADAGSYLCTATNNEGSETLEVRLTVSAPLGVHVQPAIQTVDLGKPAYLVSGSGEYPMSKMSFRSAVMEIKQNLYHYKVGS